MTRARAEDGADFVLDRLLAMSPGERSDFLLDRLWSIDWWMRGRMMRLPGYVLPGEASSEERAVAENLRAVGAVMHRGGDPPGATVRLYRAVVVGEDDLPRPGRRALRGAAWRTARRPVQSWTDTLAAARAFASSVSGRAHAEPGSMQFIVCADVPTDRVLFTHEDLRRGIRTIRDHARRLASSPSAAAELERAADRHMELVLAMAPQREVVVDLPRGEATIRSVHGAPSSAGLERRPNPLDPDDRFEVDPYHSGSDEGLDLIEISTSEDRGEDRSAAVAWCGPAEAIARFLDEDAHRGCRFNLAEYIADEHGPNERVAYLDLFRLAPSARRRGRAELMFAALLDKLRKCGATRVYTIYGPDEGSERLLRAFMQMRGFREVPELWEMGMPILALDPSANLRRLGERLPSSPGSPKLRR